MKNKVFALFMLFSVVIGSETHAGFIILDDFDDFESPSLLEEDREIYDEDLSGAVDDLFGSLLLFSNPAEPATLLYADIGHVDFQGIRQIVFDEFVASPSDDLTATLQVAGGATVNGVFVDSDESPQMIFDLQSDLFSTNELRFVFSSSNDPISIASSGLYGSVQAIPEPSSLMLAAVAAVAGGLMFRRKFAVWSNQYTGCDSA